MCTRCARGLLVLLALFSSLALPQKLQPPADAKAKVDAVFARWNRSDSPGCAAGATIDGSTVLSAGYGMADLEHDAAITPGTIFEPGSVTKQFTAAAVLLLAQQGKLSLDDPIRKYIPEVPDYDRPITIRHLLHHTSGLRDWGNVAAIGGWPRTTRVYTHAFVLDIVSRQRALNYAPGSEYSYTNTGFNLAAILVERVSGKSLPAFTRESIFTPLAMASTGWRDDFRRIVKNRAVAYAPSGGAFVMNMPFESVYGNSSLLTTVGDLLRWNQNFTDLKVGGRALIETQQQRGRLMDGRTIAYAAGLMMLHWKGLAEVSHSGSTAGYSAWLGRYPEQGLSVAVLCNVATNATQLGHAVAEVYLGDAVRPKAQDPVALDVTTLEASTGLYRSLRDHETLTVALENGQLRLDRRGVLKPTAANVFAVGEEGRAEFETDGAGKVVRLRIATEADPNNVYEKVEPARPALADLEGMVGEYTSDEAEVTFLVVLDGGRLVMRRRPDAAFPLTPTYRDGFSCALGSVRFLRDRSGRVNEMSIGEARVWDLRLRRSR